MATISINVDQAERERFEQQAAAEGLTLSQWIREAARARLDRDAGTRQRAHDQLRRLWRRCDAAERMEGAEPQWEAHLQVMRGSRAEGTTST